MWETCDMKMSIKKSLFGVSTICLILLALAPANSPARVYINTEIASGIVTDISNNVITLDSGVQYYPAAKATVPEINVGTAITLRFYTDTEQKNRYLEVAPGKNSLAKLPVPVEKKRGHQ